MTLALRLHPLREIAHEAGSSCLGSVVRHRRRRSLSLWRVDEPPAEPGPAASNRRRSAGHTVGDSDECAADRRRRRVACSGDPSFSYDAGCAECRGCARTPPRLGAAAATALAARAQASQIRPDVKATLPPGAVARAAPTEQPTPAQPRPQLNEPRPDARAMLAIPSVTRSESPPRHEPLPAVTKRRSVMPRARKVGGKTPSFALRIKKSGTHKIAVVSEVTRKSRSAIAGKGRPRTTVRKALEKPAARRIGVRTENGNALASTKAATRIVGVPRHSSRIPISTTP
jgi:hypothetical protein